MPTFWERNKTTVYVVGSVLTLSLVAVFVGTRFPSTNYYLSGEQVVPTKEEFGETWKQGDTVKNQILPKMIADKKEAIKTDKAAKLDLVNEYCTIAHAPLVRPKVCDTLTNDTERTEWVDKDGNLETVITNSAAFKKDFDEALTAAHKVEEARILNYSWWPLGLKAGAVATPTLLAALGSYFCCGPKADERKPSKKRRKRRQDPADDSENSGNDDTNTSGNRQSNPDNGRNGKNGTNGKNEEGKPSGFPGWAIALLIVVPVLIAIAVGVYCVFCTGSADEEYDVERGF